MNSKQDSSVINPMFFQLRNEDDRKKFEVLLANHPVIEIFDNYYEQKKELNKIKSLKGNFFSDEPKESNYLQSELLAQEGMWVYYPWLNKVVHILEKEDFITVRTNRNQHKITESEQESLRNKKVGIIGLSVGQSIAMALVLERGCGELRLADFDVLELSNLNRIKTGLYNLGLKKTTQVAREIAEIDPYFTVVCYNEGITENNIDDFLTKSTKLDLLIEECDGLDMKIVSRIKAKEYKIPVLMETNDRGMLDIERYDLNPDYPLLHNLIGNISWKELSNLSNEQKLPMAMRMAGFKDISPRQKLTVLEMGKSISTWPQLASSVVLGAGITSDVTRRILLGQLHISGRFYVDIESIVSDNKITVSAYSPPEIKEITKEEMRIMASRIANKHPETVLNVARATIEKIIADAVMAPSSGNDQPWKFFFSGNRLFLFHEVARSYSFGDYKNMASYVSLGGLIENMILSTHNQKLEISVTLFPEINNTPCIALFDFKELPDITTESHDWDHLYDCIYERCTNRKTVPNEEAPQEILQELKQAAESFKYIETAFVSDKAKLHTLGNIISASDRIRIMHPQGHYDFFNREIRATSEEMEAKRTGMDIASLELTQQAKLALELVSQQEIIKVLRDINGLQALKEVSVPNVVNASAMGLIQVSSFTPLSFINGGRAMQRQWLTATRLGYAYHPMVAPLYLFYRLVFGNGEGLNESMITELKELRKLFMTVFPGKEDRGEVLLFRIFKAENIKIRSLRLPLNEVLYTN